jgi:lincosamide nucleotidyltransferase A/C/D/E
MVGSMGTNGPDPPATARMTAADVLEVLEALAGDGIPSVVDGGWGVDALVGRETRPHRDLDLVLAREDLSRVEVTLGRLGYRHDVTAWPGPPARHVLRDLKGRQVDGHVVVPDGHGDWRQELGDGSWGVYPTAELRAWGTIGGRPVRCIGPALQRRHHAGYAPLAHDLHDLALLDGLTTPGADRHSS